MMQDSRAESTRKQVLAVAQRLCATRADWTFKPAEVVRALPHLNEQTVRTHICSRCCVNANPNHPHRWPYFRRVSHGVYRIEPKFRRPAPARESSPERSAATRVAEATPAYAIDTSTVQSTIHAVVTRSEEWYIAECLEVAVLTQGRSLDEVVANLREALELHMEGEDPAELGLSSDPRLVVNYEMAAVRS